MNTHILAFVGLLGFMWEPEPDPGEDGIDCSPA